MDGSMCLDTALLDGWGGPALLDGWGGPALLDGWSGPALLVDGRSSLDWFLAGGALGSPLVDLSRGCCPGLMLLVESGLMFLLPIPSLNPLLVGGRGERVHSHERAGNQRGYGGMKDVFTHRYLPDAWVFQFLGGIFTFA